MKKILIIEDEELVASFLQRKLSQQGYEVFVAEEDKEGLKIIRAQRPDLVVLDVVLSENKGFGIMEEMQRDESLRHIPVIVISNSGQPAELEKAKGLGARDWIIKTEFDPQEALEKVKNQIG